MFEKYTEEYLLEQARQMGQSLGVDTRQGSIYMDACMGHILRVAKFYEDLRMAFQMFSDETCTGEVLEEKAAQRQIYRKQATPSFYEGIFQGVEASAMVGDRFLADGYYFTLVSYDNGYYLQAEKPGSETNYIQPGQILIPMKNTTGLIAATLGELYLAGNDKESDDSLRQRYQDAVAFSAENGNRQQYKSWCEEFEGIGRAVITPLGKGENTVTALLISSDGRPPSDMLVERIQEEIDPGSQGLGEGKAPIGCHFYAAAAKKQNLDISFQAQISVGYTSESAIKEAKRRLNNYLKDVALHTPDEETMLVQYVKIVAILADIAAIKDFSELNINGSEGNVKIDTGYVGVLGEVSLHECIS